MSTITFEAVRKTRLVDLAPTEAFELFTSGIGRWWPTESHSYGGAAVTAVVLEPEVGGRLYEVTPDGEQDWGSVLAWEPPHRFVLDWQIGDAAGTEVEVVFTGDGMGTRVELEHRGFGASDPRERYETGWDVVLAPFAAPGLRAGASGTP